eukprot:5705787-Pleurochrysis_carterae.AAC.1
MCIRDRVGSERCAQQGRREWTRAGQSCAGSAREWARQLPRRRQIGGERVPVRSRSWPVWVRAGERIERLAD